MNKLSLQRGCFEFLRALTRNKWVSLGTVFAMSMVFFLIWLIVSVNNSSEQIINRVEQKVDIGVFFEKEASEFDISNFLAQLEGLQEEDKIQSFEYYSEEYALEEMKQKFPGQVRFLERYKFENPLQSSVEIVPKDWNPDRIFEYLQDVQFEGVVDLEFFDKYQDKKAEVSRVLQVLIFIRKAGVFLVGVFVIIAMFLITFFVSNGLHQRKKEIFIMRLVGAEHSFIRFPFLLEGVTLAMGGFLLSFLLFSVFFSVVAPAVIGFFPASSDQVFMADIVADIRGDFFGNFFFAFFLLVIGSGVISYLTVERFLKKRHLLAEH